MQPSEWVNPGPGRDIALAFNRGAAQIMRRHHWRQHERQWLPPETWRDAKAAGLVPIEDWTPPAAEPVSAPSPPAELPHEPEPIGREWVNVGPARPIAFRTKRVGKVDVDVAIVWRSHERKVVPFEDEDKAREFGLVPADEYKPEPHERWRWIGKGTRVAVGNLTVPYWIPGDTKTLPASLHDEATAAGLEFLGAA